jgi:hypothetical protein
LTWIWPRGRNVLIIATDLHSLETANELEERQSDLNFPVISLEGVARAELDPATTGKTA